MAKERKSFLLRADPKIHDALRRWSEDEYRSLNAQVEMVLRRALLDAGRLEMEEEEPNPSPASGDPESPSTKKLEE